MITALRTRRRLGRFVVLLALFAATLVIPKDAVGETLQPIKIILVAGETSAEALYAQDMGFFRKHGIVADIQIMRGGSGGAIATAILGGGVADIGYNDFITTAAARERGLPLVALAPANILRNTEVTTALVANRGSSVSDAHDLVGKTVAIPSLAGPNKVALTAWLQRSGVSPSSVMLVEMPLITMGPALQRGTVAAAVTSEPDLSANKSHTKIVAAVYDALGRSLLIGSWNATEAWVKSNPDLAVRFIESIRDAAIWANNRTNDTASLAVLAHYTPYDAEHLQQMKRMRRSVFALAFDPERMQPILSAAYEQKVLPSPYLAQDLLSPLARIERSR